MMKVFFHPGVPAALGAALLFGASTPFAKLMLANIGPWMLAGWLYLGSGLGLFIYRRVTGAEPVNLSGREAWWLSGAILAGGMLAPVLLMFGLTAMPASGASLLLNAEGVFTALLAWFAFKENFDRRIAVGMAAILVGAVILSWPTEVEIAGIWSSLAILGACLAWGIDNNLTRKVSSPDATWIASIKGLAAGTVNLVLAYASGAITPSWLHIGAAMLLGLLCYGVSLTLFVISLRHLGSARTGAYFSIAPFFGAVLALGLGEPLTLQLLCAGLLMGLGIWLHLTERHEHRHVHEALEHSHEHIHDEHHQHAHEFPVQPGVKHTHWHRHAPLIHTHAHFPDTHHRHRH